MVKEYPGEADLKNVRSHIHKFLHMGFKEHTDLRDRHALSKTYEEMKEIILEMKERRSGMSPKEKLGWYYRYWKSEGKTMGETPTFITDDWNT